MAERDYLSLHYRTARALVRDSAVSKAHRYAYVPVGKAANTNLKRWLWQMEHRRGHPAPPPEPYFAVHKLGRNSKDSPWRLPDGERFVSFYKTCGRFFTFTCVRNPFARLLSGYLDKIERNNHRDVVMSRFNVPRKNLSFAEFVEVVASQPPAVQNLHWAPQSYATQFGFVPYDAVVRLERMDDELRDVARRVFGTADSVSSRSEHGTEAADKLRAHYDPASVRRVVETYQADFEAFGYAVDLRTVQPIRAVTLPPPDPVLGLVRMMDRCWSGRAPASERDLAVPDQGRRTYYLLLYRAIQLARAADERAEAAMQEALERADPADAEFDLERSHLLLSLGRGEEAVSAARAAARKLPHFGWFHENLAIVLCKLGREADALQALRDAQAICPADPGMLTRLSHLLQGHDRLSEAIDVARRALAHAPRRAGPHLHLANLLIKSEALAEAETVLRAAIELNPFLSRPHARLGVVLFRRGSLERALQAGERAFALGDRSTPLLALLDRVRGKLETANPPD